MAESISPQSFAVERESVAIYAKGEKVSFYNGRNHLTKEESTVRAVRGQMYPT
jgi:hypothetical protein